jgi:hypothetical protein
MILYHGSNIIVEKPRILMPNRALDFGAGFYATTEREQAEKWAEIVVERTRKEGKATLNIYDFDENTEKLLVKHFETVTQEWLDFVCNYRLYNFQSEEYDLITGPIANDTTMPALRAYIEAIKNNPDEKDFFAEFTLRQLRTDRLKDQYVFKSEKALQHLKFTEAK